MLFLETLKYGHCQVNFSIAEGTVQREMKKSYLLEILAVVATQSRAVFLKLTSYPKHGLIGIT